MRRLSRLACAAPLLFATSALPAKAQSVDVPALLSSDALPAAATEIRVTARVPRGFRLDPALRPAAYRLDLTVDPAAARFSGHVEIDLDLDEARDAIRLHGRGLSVRRVFARVGDRQVAGTWTSESDAGLARVAFAEPLPAGPATLVVDYDAPFSQDPAGLFHVEVAGTYYAWSHMEPLQARQVFPCFDEPGFKAPLSLTLRTPPGLAAIGNAPELGPPETLAGLAVHHFAPTPPLPSYLVAIMVGPFAEEPGTIAASPERPGALPLRIVATRPQADALDFARDETGPIVRGMEDWFGSPFPFAKLDEVATPTFTGAMENPGAVLYRDDLLAMTASSPPSQRREFARVAAHEMAHQWFGNLVTPAWWDDLWLNESFANWLGYRIAAETHPDLGLATGTLSEGFAAMDTDALLAGRPVRQPIERESQVDAAFDAITYGKGGHVLEMLSSWVGDDAFRASVRRYIADHAGGNATAGDFAAALVATTGRPEVAAVLDSFVTRQGVPLLTLRRDGGDRVTVSQSRYAPLGVDAPDALWTIPVCLRRGSERSCHVMTKRTESWTVPGSGLVVPNAGGTGYYRFELEPQHWNELIQCAAALPPGEAMALADSLGASILAGRGTVSEMARLSRNLVGQRDLAAKMAADEVLRRFVGAGIVQPAARQGFWHLREGEYLGEAKRLGFDPRAGAYAAESPERSRLRAVVVEALLGTPRGGRMRKALETAAQAYLAGDRGALDPAWFDYAFDLHVYLRGEGAARDLVAKALASDDPRFRPIALAAAARSGSRAVAGWLLDLADPRLRDAERREILVSVMTRGATRPLGYDWIVAHLDAMLADRDAGAILRTVPEAVSHFCDVGRADRIAAEIGPRLAGTGAELDLARAVEKVRNCGVFERDYGEQVNAGLLKQR